MNWLMVTLNMIMDYTPNTKQHRLGGMQKKKTLKVYTIFSAISWKTLWTARSFRVAANVQVLPKGIEFEKQLTSSKIF